MYHTFSCSTFSCTECNKTDIPPYYRVPTTNIFSGGSIVSRPSVLNPSILAQIPNKLTQIYPKRHELSRDGHYIYVDERKVDLHRQAESECSRCVICDREILGTPENWKLGRHFRINTSEQNRVEKLSPVFCDCSNRQMKTWTRFFLSR